jgi:peptide deformylase
VAFGSNELRSLLSDMYETMIAANGAGLAAPQIGENLRVVMFEVGDNPRYPGRERIPFTVLINPAITPIGDAQASDWEGCLSVPGMRGLVSRPARILYTAFDESGTLVEREVDGFHARVVQHECDHLDGVLYPMRITDMTQFGFTEILFPHLTGVDDDE